MITDSGIYGVNIYLYLSCFSPVAYIIFMSLEGHFYKPGKGVIPSKKQPFTKIWCKKIVAIRRRNLITTFDALVKA